MKLFSCQSCGQILYFENIRCEKCGHVLGYLPDRATISALEPEPDSLWRALAGGGRYRFCKKQPWGGWRTGWGAWRRREKFSPPGRHNHIIPDLSVPENESRWRRLEMAKHRLF